MQNEDNYRCFNYCNKIFLVKIKYIGKSSRKVGFCHGEFCLLLSLVSLGINFSVGENVKEKNMSSFDVEDGNTHHFEDAFSDKAVRIEFRR